MIAERIAGETLAAKARQLVADREKELRRPLSRSEVRDFLIDKLSGTEPRSVILALANSV